MGRTLREALGQWNEARASPGCTVDERHYAPQDLYYACAWVPVEECLSHIRR
jgi:hypothetical protein